MNSKNTICKGPEKTTVDPALKVNKIQNTLKMRRKYLVQQENRYLHKSKQYITLLQGRRKKSYLRKCPQILDPRPQTLADIWTMCMFAKSIFFTSPLRKTIFANRW